MKKINKKRNNKKREKERKRKEKQTARVQGLGQGLGRSKMLPTQASATITKGKEKSFIEGVEQKRDREEA